jgi:hypothetical protein
MGHQRLRPAPALTTALAAAALTALVTGCGGGTGASGSGSPSPSATTPVSATSSAPSASPTDTATAGSGGSTGSPGATGSSASPTAGARATNGGGSATRAGLCTTGHLKAALRGLSPGAGQRYAVLTLTNTGSASCRLQGFVGLQLLGSSGGKLPTDVVRDHSGGSGKLLTLAAHGTVYTRLHWGAVPSGKEPVSGACEGTPHKTEVTPPDSYTHLTVNWGFGAVCEGGRIEVLPLAAGHGPTD